MRFMMQVRADKNTEAGVLPSKELVAAMGKFNEEMMKAGVLRSADGLQPSSKGARITFSGARRTVTEGPFADFPPEILPVEDAAREEALREELWRKPGA